MCWLFFSQICLSYPTICKKGAWLNEFFPKGGDRKSPLSIVDKPVLSTIDKTEKHNTRDEIARARVDVIRLEQLETDRHRHHLRRIRDGEELQFFLSSQKTPLTAQKRPPYLAVEARSNPGQWYRSNKKPGTVSPATGL